MSVLGVENVYMSATQHMISHNALSMITYDLNSMLKHFTGALQQNDDNNLLNLLFLLFPGS